MLDSVAKRGSGHTPDKKHPEYWNGDIKWLSLKDSDQLDNLYITDTAERITRAGIANSSAVEHPSGTVVLSRDAGVGKSAITQDTMAVSQHFMAWQCGERLNNHFLYYWLQHKKPEFERIAIGNTIKTIGLPYFKALEIPLPQLSEQQAIAAALGEMDALLGALNRLIDKKRDLKQAAMQQLLTGLTRLPSFDVRRGNQRTELGPLPEDWRVLAVGDIASVKTGPFGSSLHEEDYVAEGTPIITVEHLGERGIRHAGLPMVSDVDRRRLIAYSLQAGDIVFSRVGSVDRNALVSHAEAGWLFSGRLLRLRPSDRRVDTRYLSHHFHSEPFKQRVRSVAVGQTMASLNTQILRGVLVAVPPVAEQEAIGAVLSSMDIELTALEQRRDKTRLLKQGMMQELLTGRTRLV